MQKLQSARALLWFSAILLVVGAMVADPTAGFSVIALAGLSALGSITLGDKRLKLIGLLLLAASVALAVAYWPAAKSHQAKYQERVKKTSTPETAPAKTTENR
jgi:membrane protein implicated in regulation of membrane protease activity